MAEITRLLRSAATGDASSRDACSPPPIRAWRSWPGAATRWRPEHLAGHARPGARVLPPLRAGRCAARRGPARVLRVCVPGHALGNRLQRRERAAEKRGDGRRPLTLSTQVAEQLPAGEDEILRVHDALESLEQVDARLAQVVQMRYFGGYSEQEIAETLEVTERTVQRLWLKARLMLRAAMD